jgi:multidrug efflux pump
MAITIMGGLVIATVLTLLVVPALYALWFRVRENEPAAVSSVPDDDAALGLKMVPMRIAAE